MSFTLHFIPSLCSQGRKIYEFMEKINKISAGIPRHKLRDMEWQKSKLKSVNLCGCFRQSYFSGAVAVILFLLYIQDASAECTKKRSCKSTYDRATGEFYRIWWGLTSVPGDIPTEAKSVALWINKISSIPAGIFNNLSRCVRLNLGNNEITTIDSKSFTGMISLQNLTLANNKISHIETETFANLKSLLHIWLNINRLTRLKFGQFAGLNLLQGLWLENNQISHIEQGAFDSCYSLNKLHIWHNKLSTLSPDLFINLPRPLTLALSGRHKNRWNCSSLCWLKHEKQHGTVDWSATYPLYCGAGGDWRTLLCGEHGESLIAYTPCTLLIEMARHWLASRRDDL